MTNSRKYPYLGKNIKDGKTFVVFFGEENYGMVVMSEIEDNPKLALGTIGDFDESYFELLPNDVRVYIQND